MARLAALATLAAAALTILPANAQINDDFSRADSAAIGNGWIEKNPQSFQLAGGRAVKQGVTDGYRDNIVYRPAAEDILDVEASVQMRLSAAAPGYPQIFTRVQSGTVAQFGTIDGYILYVNGSNSEAILGRQEGANFVTTLATLNIAPALNTTDNYRLRLRSTGTNPVQLAAFVERWNGSAWVIDGQATASDASANRIATGGSVGFGGFIEASYSYDNFAAVDLGSGSNPLPTLGAINPTSATEGGSAFSLTVTGSDFLPGSVVRWNGADRATTFVSSGQLQAAITAADIATAGSASVTVFNPAPGGGSSGVQTFTIDPAQQNNPVPAITSINPNAATEGGSAFLLDVNGSGFIPGSVVRWNGADRATTYLSGGALRANITAADIASAGSASITVFNPAPGGGVSAAQTFTIDSGPRNNPVPTLNVITPDNATEGGSAFLLTLTGNNFVAGSVVRWNGSDRATTFVSATTLQANITAADIAADGTASVVVFNPAPGGGTSAARTFTIDPAVVTNPSPVLASINPNAAAEGGSAFTLTVGGSDFIASSVVRWNGSNRATTFVSPTQLQAAISAADIANAGSATVDVVTPAPGGGISASQVFTIQSTSGLFVDTFTRADSASLGNGWIEKNPQSFQLNGNGAAKQGTGLGYRDNIVYRPAAEDLLDVEASVELDLSAASPGYPQLLTRVQSGTAAVQGSFDGYILYVNNNNSEAVLGRQEGADFLSALATVNIAPALNTSNTYRMRLRTTGSAPVQLAAYIERWNGSTWIIDGQATVNDNSANRISTAGSVGFGGHVEASYRYDNFTANNLGNGSNPSPILTSVNPASATAGGSSFALTVDGSDFIPGSVVRWNGADRATTYVSPTQLQAAVTAADIAVAGSADVSVFTPAPGGGSSGAVTFTIDSGTVNNPTPVITTINPDNATEGGSAFLLDITGGGFIPGSVVRWNGANRTTTYLSAGAIRANITAADIATAGTASVTVFNPAPGGGTSAAQTFTIDAGVTNPSPTLATISPQSADEGGAAFTLTLTGSDFVPGSIVRWNGSNRATTFFSSAALQANITAADIANSGNASVTVFNPAPGGGVSTAQTFTINDVVPGAPAPVISSISPESATIGSSAQVVTLIGSNFNAQSVVNWNGSARTTNFVSSQVLEVTLPANDLLIADVSALTVVNTLAQGGGSAPHPFFVIEANGSFFLDTFNTSNSPNLGNGWTEKTPEVFSITDNAVTSIWFDRIYRDSIAYRPAAEDRLDVEVTAEFVRQPAGQFTQLHARARRSTIATPDYLESYIFYVEDNVPTGAMAIAIGPPIQSMGECIIDQVNLPQPLQVGERYRMRFLVTGQDPVRLEGRVDWFTSGAWQPFFSTTVFHDNNTVPPGYFCAPGFMPAPIIDDGASGFSKWVDQADDYDNYYWRDLSTSSGVPSITSATPDPIIAGGSGETLLVDGANFTTGSVVQWNGSPRVTTYVNSTTLQAALTAADIATQGNASVTVSTPPPGGGVSNAVVVSVIPEGQTTNPTPVISMASPSPVTVGASNIQLTINGSGFVQGALVRWNGADRATTFVSETELSATILAADIAAPGTAAVTVFNPPPGGGVSNSQSVAIVSGGDFLDDFARADGPNPQNGWIEKNPNAFSIVGGQLQKNLVGLSYVDNVMYRPAAEVRGNVETSAEFELDSATPGYPQIFARLQPGSVASSGALDGYILYINNGNIAVLGRQTGAQFVTSLASIPLSEPLTTTDVYRLRLAVTGTSPVSLTGYVERLGGSGFVVIGQATALDSSAQRISAPGVSGIGGYIEDAYRFDNFRDATLP